VTLSGVETVQERPLLSRESKARLSDCGVVHEVCGIALYCIDIALHHTVIIFSVCVHRDGSEHWLQLPAAD